MESNTNSEAKLLNSDYPRLTVEQTMEKIVKIFNEVGDKKINSDEELLRLMGFVTKSGSSKKTVAALKKYGLLLSHGTGYSLAKNALAIAGLNEGTTQKTAALKDTAFTPPIFRELQRLYHARLSSEENKVRWLVKNSDLNAQQSKQLLEIYEANISYLQKVGLPIFLLANNNLEEESLRELRVMLDLGDFHGETKIYGKITKENMKLFISALEFKAGLKVENE